MAWAVPGSGAGSETNGDDGGGRVLIFGALVTLNDCVAASSSMTSSRAWISDAPALPTETWASAMPSGSVDEPGLPVMTTSAAATTATVAADAVIRKAPTLLRLGRRPDGRLRCCDNAVLPSA
jgi:hypothetical protein